MDSRWLQIGFLGTFLIFGFVFRDFSIRPNSVLMVPLVAVVTQLVFIRLLKLEFKTLLSALVTSLGTLLLCRATSDRYLCLAVFLAISSKFVLTFGKKHYFNPANFGIAVLALSGFPVWTSPSQWGEGPMLLLWIGALGVVIVTHASRYDVSFFFLGSYLSLLLARVFYLGQPISVFIHQLQSGALLLFTFFMISDPRSIPDHRAGRFLLALSVAVLTYVLRFHFFEPNALLYALFFLSPITVLIDKRFPHARYEWGAGGRSYGFVS